ncbi:MAG: hypothetical protein IJN54_02615, partial [Lachnospiraceae bacterium]|nr:hypothetical protein [Lachnospiraceae bacterium]
PLLYRKGDCALSTYCTTRIAGGLLFRASPFFNLEKLRRAQQTKVHNKTAMDISIHDRLIFSEIHFIG